MDAAHGLEIEQVDTSGIDPEATEPVKKCPRCEQDVRLSTWDSHMASHSSEIRDWLFLGSVQNAENVKELTVRTGITHILCMAGEVHMEGKKRVEWEDYNKERGAISVVQKFDWDDSAVQDIMAELKGALDCIHNWHSADPAKNHVLVHCVQGISRSATVVIAYLMQYERLSLRDAYTAVKTARSIASPRAEFIDQLGRVEMHMFGVAEPSLTSGEVYEGKVMLNVDFDLPKASEKSWLGYFGSYFCCAGRPR